jgi:predicted nucleotidyltransferase
MTRVEFYLNVIEAFNQNKVEYMVIGGQAVNYHGYLRSTMDMDIWVDTHEKNLKYLLAAFLHLGYSKESSENAIAHIKKNHMIKIPKDNNIIDLMDSFMVKMDFKTSYRNTENVDIKGVIINVMGLDDLIECKNKSNRTKDLLDVKELKTLKDLKRNRQG